MCSCAVKDKNRGRAKGGFREEKGMDCQGMRFNNERGGRYGNDE